MVNSANNVFSFFLPEYANKCQNAINHFFFFFFFFFFFLNIIKLSFIGQDNRAYCSTKTLQIQLKISSSQISFITCLIAALVKSCAA
jgi:F0F1-type ATP synthase membrane subunit a